MIDDDDVCCCCGGDKNMMIEFIIIKLSSTQHVGFPLLPHSQSPIEPKQRFLTIVGRKRDTCHNIHASCWALPLSYSSLRSLRGRCRV